MIEGRCLAFNTQKRMASFYRRQILNNAFAIVWQKKYLWFIAFFAGLTSYGGEVNFLLRKLDGTSEFQAYLVTIRNLIVEGKFATFMQALRNAFTSSTLQMLGILMVILIMALVIAWLIIVSQGALVRIMGRTILKKPTSFFDGLTTGITKFWSIFQISLIALLAGWAAWIILAGLPSAIYLLNGAAVWSNIAVWGSYLTIPISLMIAFLVQYAIGWIVLQESNVVEAMKNSWTMFRSNFWISIEMAILVFLVQMAVFVVITAVAFFMIYSLFTESLTAWSTFTIVMAMFAFELAILSAYGYAAWTTVFLKLLEGKQESKIGRWVGQLMTSAGPKQTPS